jgi:phosphoribosylanthranilate isomerase
VLDIHAALRLDAIQLHGDESPELCAQLAAAAQVPVWKAIAVAAPRDVESLDAWPVDAILLDAPTPGRGGAGARFDHALACEARRRHPARKLVLAGGLDATTVAAAIALVQPWAVDVATGVQAAPGVVDPVKLAAFVAAVLQSR